MSIASFFLVFEKERSCDCHDSSVFGAWDLFMQTFFFSPVSPKESSDVSRLHCSLVWLWNPGQFSYLSILITAVPPEIVGIHYHAQV